MTTFKLLHEKVQKYIYKQGWSNFRPIQDEAIKIILQEKKNLLICAPTASGKTEAAFLPIVSSIVDNSRQSIRAIYISPLKALINDQFKRIDLMCENVGVTVTKWHGDVGQDKKNKVVKNPEGILLITPESLEALLLHRSIQVRQMFFKLDWIVIDEIHSFIGSERGAQLLSLITRIENECQIKPLRIGLSATVGNPVEVINWLSKGENEVILDNEWDNSGIEGILKGIIIEDITDKEVVSEDKNNDSTSLPEEVYNSFQIGKNLIFGNSKAILEDACIAVSSIAKKNNSHASFLIHHGSLSKNIRETAEYDIKNSNKPLSIFCTSTLEMGIDIGNIEKIGLISPPWAVSSFAQRVGRSGRREGTNKRFEFFITQEKINSKTSIDEIFREDLVKSIAIVELYLKGFKEPLNTHRLHLSTMAHQILSISAQKAGVSISDIKRILSDGFIRKMNENDFNEFFDNLILKKLIYQDGSGLVSPGAIGEKLIEHYEFYSVFQSSEQWDVIFSGDIIGQVPMTCPYRVGDNLLLGARRWSIVDLNESSKKLIVVSAKNAKPPIFSPSYGVTHPEIHRIMKDVYESVEIYPYLDSSARQLLVEARDAYRDFILENNPNRSKFPIFEGTLVQNTIAIALRNLKIDFSLSECILEVSTRDVDWKKELLRYFESLPSSIEMISSMPRGLKEIEKFDSFLPDNLLDLNYVETMVDLDNSKKWIKAMVAPPIAC